MEDSRERFLRKVIVPEGEGCWEWNAMKTKDGYGRFRVSKYMILSHRFSYCLHNGCELDSIKELVVRHSCNNTSCVNPAHLSTGTQADNIADMITAGRRANTKGMANGRCKLTPEQVRAIRKATGSQKDIAKAYGITTTHVYYIKARKSQAHIPD